MITVKTIHEEIVLKPTMFPDGTSQIWKLPEEILSRKEFFITWHFESEREIIDLYSFKTLFNLSNTHMHLHIPYLPYGRQDKGISNETTFNLYVFAELINNLGFFKVTTVDAHSIMFGLIENCENLSVVGIHEQVINDFRPTYIVFPDKGAMDRYGKELSHLRTIYCEKTRDQLTGNITGNKVHLPSEPRHPNDPDIDDNARLLIIDDICDGGATFIGVAKSIRKMQPKVGIGLFVTHGIFSKGRQHLLDNGIDLIFTTNSLPQNKDGFEV